MDVHGALVDIGVTTPDMIEELFAREDPARPQHEEFEQPVLGGSEVEFATGTAHALYWTINPATKLPAVYKAYDTKTQALADDVDGTPITGTVTVNFGLQGRADAPQAIDLVVEEGSSTTLVVELRAGVWLPRLNRDTRRVDASDFLEALRVRRRAGAPPPP